MSKLIIVALALFLSIASFAQNKKHVITEQGVLFFSTTYDLFLDNTKIKDVITFVYIPDIFFPIKDLPEAKSISDAFKTDNLKEGIGLTNVDGRDTLKLLSEKFINADSLNSCYTGGYYYLLPVELSYVILSDYLISSPCYKSIDVKSNQQIISFDYLEKEIQIISIKPITSKVFIGD